MAFGPKRPQNSPAAEFLAKRGIRVALLQLYSRKRVRIPANEDKILLFQLTVSDGLLTIADELWWNNYVISPALRTNYFITVAVFESSNTWNCIWRTGGRPHKKEHKELVCHNYSSFSILCPCCPPVLPTHYPKPSTVFFLRNIFPGIFMEYVLTILYTDPPLGNLRWFCNYGLPMFILCTDRAPLFKQLHYISLIIECFLLVSRLLEKLRERTSLVDCGWEGSTLSPAGIFFWPISPRIKTVDEQSWSRFHFRPQKIHKLLSYF